MAKSRKDSYLAIALLLAIALFLALTNPGPGDFKAWMEIQSAKNAKAGTTGLLNGALSAAGSLKGSLKSGLFERSNLGLVSLYSRKTGSGATAESYLGLARTFIRLK